MAQGQTISGDLQKSLRPVIQKIAVALQNPTQRQRLSKSLGESLSQTDLSKLGLGKNRRPPSKPNIIE